MSDDDQQGQNLRKGKRVRVPSEKRRPQKSDNEDDGDDSDAAPAKSTSKSKQKASSKPKEKTKTKNSTTSSTSKRGAAAKKPKTTTKDTTTPTAPSQKGKQKDDVEASTEKHIEIESSSDDEPHQDDEARMKRREDKVNLTRQKISTATQVSANIIAQGFAKAYTVPIEWINDDLSLKTNEQILGKALSTRSSPPVLTFWLLDIQSDSWSAQCYNHFKDPIIELKRGSSSPLGVMYRFKCKTSPYAPPLSPLYPLFTSLSFLATILVSHDPVTTTPHPILSTMSVHVRATMPFRPSPPLQSPWGLLTDESALLLPTLPRNSAF